MKRINIAQSGIFEIDATFTGANDENEPKNTYVNSGKKNSMPACNISNTK